MKEYAYILYFENDIPTWLDGTFYAKDKKEAIFLGVYMGLKDFEVCRKIDFVNG